MRYTVYRILVCSRTKIRMISSLRNCSVPILDADLFTIVVFQILDIKSNYLPGIVQDITFQLVPPYSHRRNSAEGAIRSFKDHLIAGLCSTEKSFPMHLWDRILPQAVITLNMLIT
jgi:hypothetical protein